MRSRDTFLASFARFVASRYHRGPLTVGLSRRSGCVRGKGGQGSSGTWARRLARLRHFICYLKQFDPDTEIPEAALFGPEPGRVAPHIYREEEIVELLAAARKVGPRRSLRPATYETLFGLMASIGLRVSEATHLRDADVDLKQAMLTVRQTKFAKSRQLPLHPSTVEALAHYRRQRARHVPTTAICRADEKQLWCCRCWRARPSRLVALREVGCIRGVPRGGACTSCVTALPCGV